MKIRLMSFNIQHGRNYNLNGDVIDLPLMAKAIIDNAPDFVGLQEVRCGTVENFADQPKIISAITGGSAFFGKAINLGEGKGYGNAAISHLPVTSCEIIPIPDPENKLPTRFYETRCVMKLEVDCEGKPLTLLVTHFGLNPDEQENAVDTVLKIISTCKTPVILMGDLNMSPGERPLLRLSEKLTDTASALKNEELTLPNRLFLVS